MNKIILVCGLALTLAGCNATVYPARPVVIDLETRPPLIVPRDVVYAPLPPPRPFGLRRCTTIWDNYRGQYVERRICGNHIP